MSDAFRRQLDAAVLKGLSCPHDWKIWPETDGQNQRCMMCGIYRETPSSASLSKCPSCKRVFKNGGQCAAPVMRGGCPMGGDV